jgi:PRC-barrel domain protein
MTRNTRLRVNPGGAVLCIAVLCVALSTIGSSVNVAAAADRSWVVAAGPAQKDEADDQKQSEQTPEEKFAARFPQPVVAGALLGLPVLDGNDSTIGYVREVVRSPERKIFLIVPYSGWLGWVRTEHGKRPVAVPIEVVTLLGRQINAQDMARDDFDRAATWSPGQDAPIPAEEKTLIGLGRR